jgi:hypothetical protein
MNLGNRELPREKGPFVHGSIISAIVAKSYFISIQKIFQKNFLENVNIWI